MLATLGLHATMLGLVMMPAPVHVGPKPLAPGMMMINVPATGRSAARKVRSMTPPLAPPQAPPPLAPSPALFIAPAAFPDPLSPEDRLALAEFTPTAGSAPAGAPCDLQTSLANDLREARAAQRALLAVPASARSVADAIMMWDGHWPADTEAGGKALLRALIAREIAAARSECLDQINRGPQLFLVPAAGTTIAIVIGSGEWRWRDLLAAP
jgi:hypothetical protein